MEDRATHNDGGGNEGSDEFKRAEHTDWDVHAAALIAQEELKIPYQEALKLAKDNMLGIETWANRDYIVSIKRGVGIDGMPELVNLTIRHRNGCGIHDQHEIQGIVDKLVGPGREMVELIYPDGEGAEHERHLWVAADSDCGFHLNLFLKTTQIEAEGGI